MKTKKEIKELIKSKSGIHLDLGGGGNPQAGFVNIDIRNLPEVDIVHDIESGRIPLPDNCVTRVLASHILEHICPKRLMFVMSEIHRVCRHEAQVIVSVPYSGSTGSFMDPSHCGFFNEATFQYFDDSMPLWNIYKPPVFRIQMTDYVINGNLETILQVVKEGKNEKSKKTGKKTRK